MAEGRKGYRDLDPPKRTGTGTGTSTDSRNGYFQNIGEDPISAHRLGTLFSPDQSLSSTSTPQQTIF